MDSDEPVDTKTLDFRNDHTPIDPNNSKSSLSAKMCYQPIAQQQQQCAGENLCDVVSHALVLKKLVKPACPLFNELHNFCFRPTVMTRAIRCLADRRKRGTELKFSRKLARRPVKSQMGCNKSVIEKCKIFSNY